MRMTRKDFLKASVGAAGAYAGLLVLGACGSNSPAAAPSGDCLKNGATTQIANNHPPPGQHLMSVTAADVKADTDKVYHIQGHADHDHTVLLTQADFDGLQQGKAARAVSSIINNHQHDITVTCA